MKALIRGFFKKENSIFNKLLLSFFICLLVGIHAVANDINQDQWRSVVQLSGVPSAPGMTAPSIYVFFDPNCPATAKLFRANANGKSFADAPVVWIPVYYMAADSLGKAASILREGQFSAIRTNFTLYDSQNKSGAIAPVVADIGERQKIDKAKQIWVGLTNTPATPMIVYRDKLGAGHVHLGYNPPDELERIINEAPSFHIQEYQQRHENKPAHSNDQIPALLYRYNAHGWRVEKRTYRNVALQRTGYVYTGAKLISMQEDDGSDFVRSTHYIWLGNIPLAQIDHNVADTVSVPQIIYLHTDHLASPRAKKN